MTACNPCTGEFVSLDKDKLHSFHVILRITYKGDVLVNNEKLFWPVAILKVVFYLFKVTLYDKIKERIFPYTPSEKDVEQFFKDGKCFLDKMDKDEKKDYLKKDASLPLGL
ncbi:hypothetical protein [Candidatus Electrothrix sp.]|uniref:hypothetical protein n=1 Tax=Candidatus Electrothrix sp. TaxID=2170559 RepID=UPI004057B7C6